MFQFLDQRRRDMQKAWEVFDTKKAGAVGVRGFKKVIPLLGENVTDDAVWREKICVHSTSLHML